MSTRFYAAVLLVVVGAALLFLVGPRISDAQSRSCSVPKSAGVYRGTTGTGNFVFEGRESTLSEYGARTCKLIWTVTRN
jgi:hypothetical protein